MKQVCIFFIIAALLTSASAVISQEFSNKGKKLIEYGFDVPDPEYLRKNISRIEKFPFDGVIFGFDSRIKLAFDPEPWPEDVIKGYEADLKAVKWKKYTDNFLILHSANVYDMDWFNDAHWNVVLQNLQQSVLLAKAAKCVGIAFDPEPYGTDPWLYPDQFPGKTKQEALVQLRKRGKEWIQTMQKGWNDMVLFLLFANTDVNDPLGAFCNGLLEGANKNVTIVDGNEESYYNHSFQDYVNDWDRMIIKGAQQVDPKLKNKFAKHYQAGMALYMDQTLALRELPKGDYVSPYMTPEDRLKFFEATTYWALKATDKYVWCYSEMMNWWVGRFPQGADDAIRSARAKLVAGENLGFSMDARIELAKKTREQVLTEKLVNLETNISAVATGDTAPLIDGKNDDPIWQKKDFLDGFVPPAMAGTTASPVRTSPKVTYDDQNLYVLIHCEEQDMSKVYTVGTEKDSEIWNGDCVDLFISIDSSDAHNYRHFMVNPNNVQWDGSAPPESNDVTWNANWKSAVTKDPTFWTVEMAIPWNAIGGKPAKGSFRYANLCRQSKQSGWSSWSPVLKGFLDADRFGKWTFVD